MPTRVTLVALLAALLPPGLPGVTAEESLPSGARVVRLEAFPETIELRDPFAYRQLLITAQLDSGQAVDATRLAELEQAPRHVRVSPRGRVTVLSNGEEELVFRLGDQDVRVPVRVALAEPQRPVSFVGDVQPTLSKMSCNSGTCHGSKDGKNGFKLSLRGYDAQYDHRALTDDIGARRFNRANPDQSLLLLKATGSIPHVGGVRTDIEHAYYRLIRNWIAAGARLDLDAPRVSSIQVLPTNPMVPLPGMKQQMAVLATYTDGTVRDVTRESFIESGNIETVEADAEGLITTLRRGEAPVLVRYEGAYAATTVTVMGDRRGFVWQQPPTFNYVDELVYRKLQRVQVQPSELCTDEEFLRRVYLDLTGLPPTVDNVRDFLGDTRPQREKREALIDRLVGSDDYVEHWTNKWADLLQVNRKFLGEEGAIALRNWIQHAVATNRPYDQFAREILTARGSTLDNPAAAYFKILREPDLLMENTTHLFLAVRFNCNKCHDHPFERWTQDQYYSLAAYFAQVERKEDPSYAGQKIGGSAVMGATPLVEVVFDRDGGEVTHERTGKVAPPAFPYRHDDLAPPAAPRREQLAQWVTSPQNQYFARSYVNRLWGYLFGPGIIEPIDDIRAGNPPTNPELLDALTQDFIGSGFDIQHMLRTICKSRTYQHSVATNRWNEDDAINYSHALPRRLPAEVLYDAIHRAVGSTPRIPGVPAGFRAAELPDAGVKVPFLDDFGRPVRESACECERTSGIVLGPVMKLVNGPTVADALADPDNALARLTRDVRDDKRLIEELFLRILARRPTAQELELGQRALAEAGREHEQLVEQLQRHEQELAARQPAWEAELSRPVVWQVLDPVELKSAAGATFQKLEQGVITVSGPLAKDVYTLAASLPAGRLTGIRLEALPDASLPAGGPGRAMNGNFVISELELAAGPKAALDKARSVPLQRGWADFSQDGWNVAGAVDGNPGTGWAVSPQFNQPHRAVFETAADLEVNAGDLVIVRLSQQYPDGQHALGRFRLSVTRSSRPLTPNRTPDELSGILAKPRDQRTPDEQRLLAEYFRAQDSTWKRLSESVRVSAELLGDRRLLGVQDLAWALINTPSFLFNH